MVVELDVQRTPEPELMDEVEQAKAYADADFEVPHRYIMEQFAQIVPETAHFESAVDLGCGPADITVRLAQHYPQLQIDAVDGSEPMLDLARIRLQEEDLTSIHLIKAILPDDELPSARYDLVISNSLLHHLHDPQVLWNTIRRISRDNAYIFIADLMRPDSAQRVDELVSEYAANEPQILQRDFRNSLHAAFTPVEIQSQLDQASFSTLYVEPISDRHVVIHGYLGSF